MVSLPRASKSGRPVPLDAATRLRFQLQKRSNTKPEQAVKSVLDALDQRYRRGVSTLPASPDFSNQSRGWAILVHGCFWHHHRGCARASIPKNNRDWWRRKFRENKNRDRLKLKQLRECKLNVLVIWECETRSPRRLFSRLYRWFDQLNGNASLSRR